MVLPMIGQVGSFDRPSAGLGDVLDLYLHGYVSSRLMNLSRSASSSADDDKEGKGPLLPLTVCATHIDGLVLALTPFSHSVNYRSAVLFGHAALVTDDAEKLWAMELITNAVVPQRWSETRVPPTGGEMQSTSILRVRIQTGSAKIREGMPHDDKADMNNDAVVDRVWTGVVPVYQTLGEVLPGPYNKVAEPKYLAEFRKDFNEASKEQASAASQEK